MRRMANVQRNKTSEHSRSSLNRPEELSSRRRALHPRVPPARDHKHPPGRGDKGPFTGGASPRRSRRGRCAQQPPGLPPHRTTLEGRRGKQPHCTPFIINNKTRPPKSTPQNHRGCCRDGLGGSAARAADAGGGGRSALHRLSAADTPRTGFGVHVLFARFVRLCSSSWETLVNGEALTGPSCPLQSERLASVGRPGRRPPSWYPRFKLPPR